VRRYAITDAGRAALAEARRALGEMSVPEQAAQVPSA
jgi:DNA-binding PadR family transcriptional regulator